MKTPCDTCPRFDAQRADVADFARRVAIADARADELFADSSIISDAMHSSVARLEESGAVPEEELTLDEELFVMTATDEEVPDLHAQAAQLASDLYASIPVLRAKRHADLDARIEALSATRTFCESLGSCGVALLNLED